MCSITRHMNKDNYSFFGFSCTWCKYKCARRHDMQKHMLTQKHKKNVEKVEKMGIMKIQHTPRVATTSKDTKTIEEFQPVEEVMTVADNITNDHECVCGKTYKHLSSLCKHRKKCEKFLAMEEGIHESSDESETHVDTEDDSQSKNEDADNPSLQVVAPNKDSQSGDMTELLTTLITEQSKRNEELKDILVEQSKQMKELAEKSNVTNITTNNTVNNNKFNLNLFLNTECKDAMNIMDFIDTLPVETRDLENMGNFGFVDGITKILLNGLRNLAITERPIHCTDTKRDSIYIKDNDSWEKDEQNNKMKKVIKYVRHKNVKKISEWQKDNPNFSNMKSSTHNKYMNIISNTMGGATDEEDEELQNKIIKKVAPEVQVPKNNRFKLMYNT